MPHAGPRAFVDLERAGLLKCLITQNIDDLHCAAGSRKVAESHCYDRLVRCIECARRAPRDTTPLEDLPPLCSDCGGILKSDTVSFGEPIPPDVLQLCFEATDPCDCMIVAGTSATVYPAAQFPRTVLQRGGTLIEINPYESELTAACTISIRATACEALPALAEKAIRLHQHGR